MYNYYKPQTGLKGRPVSSIEEVKATTIDFDGSVFFFPDIANKKIYTKQVNLDGTSSLFMYQLTEIPEEKPIDYVTKEEFTKAIDGLKTAITNSKGEINFEF